jgi:hypothetical protein
VVAIARGVFGGDRQQAARPLTVACPSTLAPPLRARAEVSGREPAVPVVEAVTHDVESVDV